MPGLGFNVFMGAKVTAFFLALLVVLPGMALRFRPGETILDRFYMALTHATAWTIIVVHLLVFAGVYETLSLVVGLGVVYGISLRIQGLDPLAQAREVGNRLFSVLLDVADRPGDVGGRPGRRRTGPDLRSAAVRWLQGLRRPLEGWLPAVILAAAAYLRFDHSLRHFYLGASDAYVHLAWTKYLMAGEIYRDGIYPHGFQAILSALAYLSFIDPLQVLRFAGPLVGCLLVLSVYYFGTRLVGASRAALPGATLLSVAIYGLVTNGALPSIPWRQLSPLPQEFAMVFVLPGLWFCWRYLKDRDTRYLWLFAEALFVAGASHTYAALYLVLGAGCLWLAQVAAGQGSWSPTARLAGAAALSLVLAALPLGVAMLFGYEFHGSLGYVGSQISIGGGAAPGAGPGGIPGSVDWGALFWPGNPFQVAGVYLSLWLLVRGLGSRPRDGLMGGVGFFALIACFLYGAGLGGGLTLMDPVRSGQFFALVAAPVYGVGLASLWLVATRARPAWRPAFPGLVAGVIMLVLGAYPPVIHTGDQLEYDNAVRNYVRIETKFPSLDWTLVSPVEQYSQVLHQGWHYDLAQFLEDFPLAAAGDPSFFPEIPTHFVFLLVEKRPLGYEGAFDPATAALAELPPPGDDPADAYYRRPEVRATLEARLALWAEAYRRSHGNVDIYFEDEDLKIYLIRQPEEVLRRMQEGSGP